MANNIIDSELIKSIIDLTNKLLELANTGLGQVITKILLLGGLGFGASQLLSISKLLPTIISQFKNFANVMAYTAGGAGTLTESLAVLAGGGSALAGAFASALPVILAVSAALVAFIAIGKGISELIVTYEEQKQIVQDLEAEYEKLYGTGSELDQLINKTEELTYAEQQRLYVLQAQEQSLKNQIELAKVEEYEKFRGTQQTGRNYEIEPNQYQWMTQDEKKLYDLQTAYSELNRARDAGEISNEDYANSLADLIAENEEYVSTLQEYQDLVDSGVLTEELTESEQMMITIFEAMTGVYGLVTTNIEKASDSASTLNTDLLNLITNIKDYRSSISQLSSLQDKINNGYEFSSAQIQSLIAQYPTLIDYIYKSEQGWRVEQSAVESIGVSTETLSNIVVQAQNIITNSISTATQARLKAYGIELKGIQSISDIWSSISELKKATGSIGAGDLLNNVFGGNIDEYRAFIQLGYLKEEINESLNDIADLQSKLEGLGGGGGGGGAASQVDEIYEKHKNIVGLLKSELSLMEEQDADSASLISKMEEIQNALHEQAEYMREVNEAQGKIVYAQKDINALSTEWLQIEKDIKQIYKDIAQEQLDNLETTFDYIVSLIDDKIALLEEEKAAISEDYDNQINDLKRINEELENQIALENALNDLAKAKQQKVLVYKDGRFQYIQDIDAVSEAQAKLETLRREEELEEELENLEELKEAALANIEDQIKAWEDYKEQWGSVVDNYQKEQDRLIAEEVLGIKLEGDNWTTRLENLQSYIQQYNNLMKQLETGVPVTDIKSPSNIAQGTGGISSTSGKNATATIPGAGTIGVTIIDGKTQETGLPVGTIVHAPNGKDYIITGETSSGYESEEIKSSSSSGSGSRSSSTSSSSKPNIGIGAGIGRGMGKRKYAKGTLSAQRGFSLVGEEGPEIRVIGEKDGILPADITKNLWNWGALTPSDLLNSFKNLDSFKNIMSVTIQNLNLPEVQDGPSFVNYMRNNFWRKTIQFQTT